MVKPTLPPLRPGMRAQLYSERVHRVVFCRVIKVNRVTVDVREERSGICWRLSPGFLAV